MMNQLTADDLSTQEQRVSSIASGVLSAGHFLVSVTVRGVRGSRVVEIYVDGDEGIGVDALANYSREIGFLLDTEDFIDGRYKLEVSSPGLERPLSQPRQYKKHLARKVRVKYQTPDGAVIKEGILSAVDADSIELALADKQSLKIDFSAITETKVVLPW